MENATDGTLRPVMLPQTRITLTSIIAWVATSGAFSPGMAAPFLALERSSESMRRAQLGHKASRPRARTSCIQEPVVADEFTALSREAELPLDPMELLYPGRSPYLTNNDENVPHG
jgi:hypothetical protein